MGPNVFGKAITDSTLQTMPEYRGKEITASKRSHVALKLVNADNKLVNARTFLKNLKGRYGNGVSTLCLIYNATGGTMENAGNINWFGQMFRESPYPDKIENGQWVAFLHVHDYEAAAGSIAATVYRGRNASGTVCEWMLSWYNSWDDHRVYTEIQEDGHFAQNHWTYIYNLLKNHQGPNCTDTKLGCMSSVTGTGDGTSLMFEGVMKLVNA
ncbi:hypothetical protein FNV43_RR10041 [Rhamnella rubrinervis]|uniref:23 kDa jasmonate-induced protein-like n=1 Tax=Rhamnella rubrinervis TaxID=2594499 RepID=A0A8K0HBW3_9ROSA|nr:hypothetical protein FNV43_RR10041 [Rhamnella rubrinervis]